MNYKYLKSIHKMEAKQVRDLMEAYASVYTQSEEQEVLSEDLQGAVESGLKKASEFMKTNPVGKAVGAVIAPVGKGRGTTTKAEQESKIKSNKQEDVDLFDLVKGHLMGEGFADTEEAALVIMANMSEDWKQSIVESIARGSAPNSPTGTIGSAAGTLLRRGAELLKKNIPQSGGGYSTRPGDGKPYKDGPLWGPGSSDAPVRKPAPQRKPQGAPMRDEPLW
jgi:hypothetical protein